MPLNMRRSTWYWRGSWMCHMIFRGFHLIPLRFSPRARYRSCIYILKLKCTCYKYTCTKYNNNRCCGMVDVRWESWLSGPEPSQQSSTTQESHKNIYSGMQLHFHRWIGGGGWDRRGSLSDPHLSHTLRINKWMNEEGGKWVSQYLWIMYGVDRVCVVT